MITHDTKKIAFQRIEVQGNYKMRQVSNILPKDKLGKVPESNNDNNKFPDEKFKIVIK